MVLRQPLPAPCRWMRFMLRPGPEAASSSRAAPRERGARVFGPPALDAAAARGPSYRHLQRGGRTSDLRAELRAELRSASSSHGETEGRTGRAAGGDVTPSLPASAVAATAEEEGAEQRRQAPQPRSRPPPPRARACAHPSRAGAEARARAHLQPP